MRSAASREIVAVLFDLDGTLVDSAPDLAGAVNELRTARGLEHLPYERLRPLVGSGARGMVGAAFGIDPADARFAALRDEFLLLYEKRLLRQTLVFEGMPAVLSTLALSNMPWGIVTNKASRFSVPLTAGLSELRTSGVLVSGDTTPHAKPHPAPLLAAAGQLGVHPGQCVYVGDDLRDVQAARAAGMAAVVAAWGYLGEDAAITAWQADAVIESPQQLLIWLGMA